MLRVLVIVSLTALACRAPAAEPDYAGERSIVRLEGVGWIRESDRAKAEAGWKRVDLDYLSPEESERHAAGLHRAGGHWFDAADADDYHSRIGRWWQLPGENFVVYSTARRSTALVALEWMAHTRRDLERIFGTRPELPATVILLRSVEQYNAFAATVPEPGRVAPESRGLSGFHHAFFADQWLDVEHGNDYPGAACTYWDDRTETGNAWGPFAVRHAAAHAWIEALDSSPRAIGAYRAAPDAGFPRAAFWDEKELPLWLRYGAATYVERFFVDEAANDPLWARRWSLDEVAATGGPTAVADVLAFDVDPTEVESSRKLMLDAGLLVAFVLDGGVPEVEDAHAALRDALA